MNILSQASKSLFIAVENGFYSDKFGNVYSPKGNKLNGSKNRHGYIRFSFRCKIGLRHTVMVHQFIAFKKYGHDIFETQCVRHLDGIKSHNFDSNILIGSFSDNQKDMSEDSIQLKREKISQSTRKYDRKKVIDFYNKIKSYNHTMNHFNIKSTATLWRIINE